MSKRIKKTIISYLEESGGEEKEHPSDARVEWGGALKTRAMLTMMMVTVESRRTKMSTMMIVTLQRKRTKISTMMIVFFLYKLFF